MPSLVTAGTDWDAVEADENVVRRNTAPVDAVTEAAEIDHDPQFNELAPDRNPDLGLTTRQEGSRWYDRVKSTAGLFFTNLAQNHNRHNRMISRQISTSGTAAAREEAGEWGHGSMPFAVGIEPLNPAQVYGQDYFAAFKPEGPNPAPTDAGLRPVMGMGSERDALGAQAQDAKSAARDASMAALYGRFLGGN